MKKTFEEVRGRALEKIRSEFGEFAERFADVGVKDYFYETLDIYKEDLFGAIKFARDFGVISSVEAAGFNDIAYAIAREAVDDYTEFACERIWNRRNDDGSKDRAI